MATSTDIVSLLPIVTSVITDGLLIAHLLRVEMLVILNTANNTPAS